MSTTMLLKNIVTSKWVVLIYYTKITEVNLFVFVYRLFHKDEWREIFMKQSVDKHR